MTPHLAETFASVHSIDVSLSMLKTFSTHVQMPNVTHSLHTLGHASDFTHPQPSPTADDPERVSQPPRAQWDVLVINMTLHHVDNVPDFWAGAQRVLVHGGWCVVTENGTFADPAAAKVAMQEIVKTVGLHFSWS